MDLFLNYKRQWSTVRSAEQNHRFYDANLSDDELDIFHNHLHEINHVHQLDRDHAPQRQQRGAAADSRHRRHRRAVIDPRTGHEIRRFVIDATFCTRPQFHAAFDRPSRLHAGQHSNGLRAMQIIAYRRTGATASLSRRDEDILQLHAASEVVRLAEQRDFDAFAREWFTSNAAVRSSQWRPFFWGAVAHEWLGARHAALHAYADRSYALLTAIPLDHAATTVAAAEPPPATVQAAFGDIADECGAAGHLPKYTTVRPFTSRVLGGRARPVWPVLDDVAQPTTIIGASSDIDVRLSVSVIRQLIDYPTNSTTAWLIPFELRQLDDGRSCCIFEEPLPDAVLTVKRRVQLALRRDLLASTCSACGDDVGAAVSPAEVVMPPELGVDESMPYKPMAIEHFAGEAEQPSTRWPTSAIIVTLRDRSDNDDSPLRLAVQTQADGVDEREHGTTCAVHISVKPEYQTSFGAEQMTESELIHEWCQLAFYPNSQVERYRIDVETSTILRVDRLTRVDVEEEMLRLYALRAEHLLLRLCACLRMLLRFPCKPYLMRHSSRPDRTVRVYGQTAAAAAAVSSGLSVQQMLAEEAATAAPADGNAVSYTPIDASILTEMHLHASTLPGAFPVRKPMRHRKGAVIAFVPQPKQNDRQGLVARAQSKAAELVAASKAADAQRRRNKKQRTQKRKLEEKQEQQNDAGECDEFADNPYLSRDPMAGDAEPAAPHCRPARTRWPRKSQVP